MSGRRKVIALTAILLAAALAMVGCGASETETEAPEVQASTEAPTENEETPTEEDTSEEAEETTEEETETEETEAEEETEAAPEANVEIPTNGALLSMINTAFGIMTDNTVEGDVQAARDWDIIGAEEVIDTDAEITAEFLISAVMRATGFVSGNSTMVEILESAIQRGVIPDTDLSAIDLSKAAEIVEKGKDAWAHQEFDNEIHVELCEGVIDLTGMTGEFTISGNTVTLPAEDAAGIEPGTVYILPKNAAGQGGAYKAQSVTDGGDGSIVIDSIPADAFEVYKSIITN